MCHNGANRTERGARGSESGIGAAAQALVQGSAWGFVRGYAGVCGGVECVGTGRVAGRLRGGSVAGGGVLRREGYRDGGLSGWRADGVAGRRGAGVVVVSCGWSLARLLRDCCGRLAGCGGSWVQAGAAVAGTCCGSGCFGEGMLRGGGMRGDCRFCCGMGRRMDVEELTGRRGFCPRGGLSGWKADGAQRRKGRS